MIRVDHCRQSAPSYKSWKIADPSFRGFGKGSGVPTCRVLVATDAQGYSWVHHKIFRPGELNKAREIQIAVQERGFIDERHWRRADRREY